MAKAGMEGGDAAVGTAADNPLETYNLGGIFHTGASPVAGKEPGHTNTAKVRRESISRSSNATRPSPQCGLQIMLEMKGLGKPEN